MLSSWPYQLDVPLLLYSNEAIAGLLPLLPSLCHGYRPPALLPSGLLQSTLADAAPPPGVAMTFVREDFPLNERDYPTPRRLCCPEHVPCGTVSIDWLVQADEDAPVCILVPGLTGSSSTAYILEAASALHRSGFRVGCFNPRGRGGNKLETPFLYSAGYTEDIRHVIGHIRCRFPNAMLTAAGYSLGASYLAKYVGEEGAECPLAGAALFACPVALQASIARLGSTFARRMIDRHVLVPSVQAVMREYLPVLRTAKVALNLEAASAATSMEAFDDAAIAPMMGCASADQYYDEASCAHVLRDVRVPLLFLSALNDPIAPADTVDTTPFVDATTSSPAPLLLAITRAGGHSMGWPEGWRGTGRRWGTAVLTEWVQALQTLASEST